MKKKHIYIYLLGMLLLSVGCTGKFREFNTDQSGVTDDDLLIDDNGYGIRLGIIQQGIYFNYDFGKGKNWPFQLIQNLNADMFSGYMHDGKPLNAGTHNSDYNMQDVPSHLRFAGRIDTLRRASRPSVRAVGFDGFVIK